MKRVADEEGSLLSTGDIVDRFDVETLLGEGGIAQVYRVRHRRLGSLHALKLLTLEQKGVTDRLILEGQIQAQLRHPNVVAVTDVIEHEGRTGLLMEYVEGRSLEDWLMAHGALPVAQALGLLAQILSGVAAAHAAGVLHRDLKPANILLSVTRQGMTPKVTDFGIAKLFDESGGTGGTRQGATMGTPGYMAPEQIEDSSKVDARADIFALGAIAYELVSGQPALRRSSLVETFSATAQGTFSELLPRDNLDASVIEAIHRALSPDLEKRQSSVHQLTEEIFAEHPELRALVLGTPLPAAGSIQTDGSRGNPTLVQAPTKTPTQDTFQIPLDAPPDTNANLSANPDHGNTSPTRPPPPDLETPSLRIASIVEPGPQDALLPPGRRWPWVLLVVTLGTAAALALVLDREDPPEPAPAVLGAPEPIEKPSAQEVPEEPMTVPARAPDAEPEERTGTRPGQKTRVPETPESTPAPLSSKAPVTAAPQPDPEPQEEPTPAAAEEAPEKTVEEPTPAAAEEAPEKTVEEPTTAQAETAAEPAEAPAGPDVPDLRGTWDGRSSGRPMRLVVKGQSGEKLLASIEITLGGETQTLTLSGRIDPLTHTVKFWKSGEVQLMLKGTVSGRSMQGTLTHSGQREPVSWKTTLTRGAY